MKYIKKLVALLAIAVLSTGLAGCNDNNETPTESSGYTQPNERPSYPDRGYSDPNQTLPPLPPRNPDGSLG